MGYSRAARFMSLPTAVGNFSPRLMSWTSGTLADKKPGSPTSYDDEFDKASLDPKWSTVNFASGTETKFANSHLIFKTPAGNASHAERLITQSFTDAGTWQITAKAVLGTVAINGLSFGDWLTATNNDADFRAGIYVRDSGTGWFAGMAIVTWQYRRPWVVNPEFWTSPTNCSNEPNPIIVQQPWAYLRLTCDSTNIAYQYSLDGSSYSTAFTQGKNIHVATINQIALAVGVNQWGQTDFPCGTLGHFDWVRKTA